MCHLQASLVHTCVLMCMNNTELITCLRLCHGKLASGQSDNDETAEGFKCNVSWRVMDISNLSSVKTAVLSLLVVNVSSSLLFLSDIR